MKDKPSDENVEASVACVIASIMSNEDSKLVNPIPPEFIDKLDPEFVELYNRYQGNDVGHGIMWNEADALSSAIFTCRSSYDRRV